MTKHCIRMCKCTYLYKKYIQDSTGMYEKDSNVKDIESFNSQSKHINFVQFLFFSDIHTT